MWGATFIEKRAKFEDLFQSTHPCGVRPLVSPVWNVLHQFQSTHPCGVRQKQGGCSDLNRLFQSTHPCGVRLDSYRYAIELLIFQSTHPCGVRHNLKLLHNNKTTISIHAPMWGATLESTRILVSSSNFNPRTHVGCDLNGLQIEHRVLFQSTHPCGVRLFNFFRMFMSFLFQSTHPCGVRRWFSIRYVLRSTISIHAPMWGATIAWETSDQWTDISIHAPMWGATGFRPDGRIFFIISIHAPMWGATSYRRYWASRWYYFNPRTHVGCDYCLRFLWMMPYISIHAPMWGATGITSL